MKRLVYLMMAALTITSLTASAAPVSAGGFVPKTVEEIEEGTATCDFDGDGVFTDYEVTPNQMVLDNIIKLDVTDHYIHIKRVLKFDGLEYTFAGAMPSAVYFTVTIVSDVYVDLDTGIVRLDLVQAGDMTDAFGNLLFRGSWVASTEFVDDAPLWITETGTPGFPCRFGF